MTLPKFLTIVTPFSKALAMILFIALPFIGFYLGVTYQNQLSPSPTMGQNQESKATTTSNWQNYTNQYFSLQYPSTWTVKTSDYEDGTDTSFYNPQTKKISKNGGIWYEEFLDVDAVSLSTKTAMQVADEYEAYWKKINPEITIERKNFSRDGMGFVIYDSVGVGDGPPGSFVTISNGKMFVTFFSSEGILKKNSIEDQIFSTFKFTDQTPTVSPIVSDKVACTMDAMQCPDGSWTGRSGPKCEFKCPIPN